MRKTSLILVLCGGSALAQDKPALRVVVDGVAQEAAAAGDAVRGFRPKGEAYAVACEAGQLLSGAQREMAGAVPKAVEQEIGTCLAQLRY